mgnify:CR=1 FL=1
MSEPFFSTVYPFRSFLIVGVLKTDQDFQKRLAECDNG